MSTVAAQVAEHVRRAADEMAAAAAKIPDCNCETLQADGMARVLADVARAEAASQQVHAAFRELERRHGGAGKAGKATLEVQPLDGCVACAPVEAAAPANISELAAAAPSEATGGQCC